jgi:hypothetical protein
LQVCSVVASGDGRATMNVTANDTKRAVVSASLTNGSCLEAHFTGGTPPVLSSPTPQLSLAAGATFTWTVQALVLSNGQPAANQSVAWQCAAGISTGGSSTALTNAVGIATKTLTVGPLAEGQTATISACLNGTSQCVVYTAFGAWTENGWLQPVSGVAQTLDTSTAPAPIVVRLLDNLGHPRAGGAVALYQSITAFTPPCSPHTVCVPGAQLATQTATATSDIGGVVSFSPLTLPGVATTMTGLAAAGNTSTVSIAIHQHP